jgi:hypothetical protein
LPRTAPVCPLEIDHIDIIEKNRNGQFLFYISQRYLKVDAINKLDYELRRNSGGKEKSSTLWLRYDAV